MYRCSVYIIFFDVDMWIGQICYSGFVHKSVRWSLARRCGRIRGRAGDRSGAVLQDWRTRGDVRRTDEEDSREGTALRLRRAENNRWLLAEVSPRARLRFLFLAVGGRGSIVSLVFIIFSRRNPVYAQFSQVNIRCDVAAESKQVDFDFLKRYSTISWWIENILWKLPLESNIKLFNNVSGVLLEIWNS